jgi:hypothetical protein
MLARFGALIELPSHSVVSETLDQMKELLVARRCVNVKPRCASARSNVSSPPSTPRCTKCSPEIRSSRLASTSFSAFPPSQRSPLWLSPSRCPSSAGSHTNASQASPGSRSWSATAENTAGKRYIRGGRASLRQALCSARPRRCPLQRRPEGQISGPRHRGKARQGRTHRHHAEAPYTRQCSAKGCSAVDAEGGLIKTDALALNDCR